MLIAEIIALVKEKSNDTAGVYFTTERITADVTRGIRDFCRKTFSYWTTTAAQAVVLDGTTFRKVSLAALESLRVLRVMHRGNVLPLDTCAALDLYRPSWSSDEVTAPASPSRYIYGLGTGVDYLLLHPGFKNTEPDPAETVTLCLATIAPSLAALDAKHHDSIANFALWQGFLSDDEIKNDGHAAYFKGLYDEGVAQAQAEIASIFGQEVFLGSQNAQASGQG